MGKDYPTSKNAVYSVSDSLTQYYVEISKVIILSPGEERRLIIEYLSIKKETPKKIAIRGRIIQSALRYVIAEARKHPRAIRDRSALQDLISAGNIGLVRALNKFQPEQGTRFLTYAGWWVRHEMREAAKHLNICHVPTHALSKGVKTPIPIELTEYDTPEPQTSEPIDDLHFICCVEKLLQFASLNVRETFIVKSCYGIDTIPRTLKQVGNILGITGERVRQIREVALRKLRVAAQTHDLQL